MSLNNTSIEIFEYDKEWVIIFLELENVLKETLGDLILRIEHVGSTSVRGLGAKPIIDIDIVIDSNNKLTEVINHLTSLGYIHEGDLGVEGREAFARKDEYVPWIKEQKSWMKHHLYVCTKDSDQLKKHIKFRDYLRNHPEAVIEYEKLKKELAKNAKSRLEYTDGKSEFILRILNKA